MPFKLDFRSMILHTMISTNLYLLTVYLKRYKEIKCCFFLRGRIQRIQNTKIRCRNLHPFQCLDNLIAEKSRSSSWKWNMFAWSLLTESLLICNLSSSNSLEWQRSCTQKFRKWLITNKVPNSIPRVSSECLLYNPDNPLTTD